MFTQPAPAPSPPGLTTPVVVSASSPSAISPASPTARTSRLRGLSYLRTYTQHHLLSREHSGSGSSATSPTTTTAARPTGSLTRSISTPDSPSSKTAARSAAGTNHRYSLLPAHTSHPLASSSSSAEDAPSAASGSGSAAQAASSANTSSAASTDTAPSIASATGSTAQTSISQNTTDSAVGSTNMVRTRSATVADVAASGNGSGSSSISANTGAATNGSVNLDILPSIRFSAFYDPRATRPSLTFPPVSRTLPTGSEVIRVGRYSERDSQPPVPVNTPSAAPVGFKSKVVSRRHCEFWYEGGKWYIKDVKSSSGTFLNHIRLSPPGTESKPFPVNDGDIVQLGIDFKGGEEMIFRCVKMRLELNRGWQNKLNTFNMTTHKRLRNMVKPTDSGASQYSQDCSICLSSIAPCQCLFVAPCSHTWHYKCIRALLSSPQYPIFICPNCRAAADLEAEVDDPEEWEQLESEPEGADSHKQASEEDSNIQSQEGLATPATGQATSRTSAERPRPRQSARVQDDDIVDVTMMDVPAADTASSNGSAADTPLVQQSRPAASHATSDPVPIPVAAATAVASSSAINNSGRGTRTPSPNGMHPALLNPAEGPITPRNDAGPWVFDGSGLRVRNGVSGGVDQVMMESLDGVAES
ncbi:E3 ubiquitin-protein ligase DMA2 [Pleurostoma richardsiae]|uniref:RING-type E3 ubiquitin transferase n=1 Tax=Pleurostoma richardsiae TaxID=41990 RepID=A0AA38R6K1_9PEZI|nr:E3 ubiquitin-protein ligase DMA2 [Pleurostoma richardsiae]